MNSFPASALSDESLIRIDDKDTKLDIGRWRKKYTRLGGAHPMV